MSEQISESVAVLPPEMAMRVLPYAVAEYMLGAECLKAYKNGDGVALNFEGQVRELAAKDFDKVATVATELEGELALGRVPSARQIIKIIEHAARKIRRYYAGPAQKSVAMLRDKSASGWWRMVLPCQALASSGWRLDCTSAPIQFDALMEYDTIFVQRLHDWESFYTLRRLKEAGKRIVYDIDDDLFNITPDNPAYGVITRDDQYAASSCIQLADVVTVTTAELGGRIHAVTGAKPVVIPNAMDVRDGWLPTCRVGSPDNFRRIFWSGGASHAVDWEECFHAVKDVMTARSEVRLVILGFLPPCIERELSSPAFQGRIEFLAFGKPETYYQIIHHVRADVAVAPIQKSAFNACKSPIKFLEYSLIGIPTVASNWKPYADVIDNGVNGRLVSSRVEWTDAIIGYLDSAASRVRTVEAARSTCACRFDLARTAEDWAGVLCAEESEPSDE